MRKTFLMVAAVAAMLIATGFTACKPNSTPKEGRHLCGWL